MSKFGEDLIASMRQALDHARGKKVPGMRITVVEVEVPDVKAIRRSLRMSQTRFAVAFQIPLPTVKNWEQGRRYPDAPAIAYLKTIKSKPGEVMGALRESETPRRLKGAKTVARSHKAIAAPKTGKRVARVSTTARPAN
jgi:putative transcriptional regulator